MSEFREIGGNVQPDWMFVSNLRQSITTRKHIRLEAEQIKGRQHVLMTRSGPAYAKDGDWVVYDHITESKMVFSDDQFRRLFRVDATKAD